MAGTQRLVWQLDQVHSPHLDRPVPVIAAKNIPYVADANRFQNINIYLSNTPDNSKLAGSPVTSLPELATQPALPQLQVHIHGGAWRDLQLTSSSIEAAVAHTFSDMNAPNSIIAVASINYTNSPFPTHPTLPYDPIKDNHTDPSREAKHPMHVRDVLCGFAFLKSLGLTDGSYVLSGHSAGACLAFQSILQPPHHWGLDEVADAPRPAALLGMNGLYDLPDLVDGLGTTHAHLKDVYADLIGIAFGSDQDTWLVASPTHVDVNSLATRVKDGKAPELVVLDQSTEDQLVPMNQTEKLEEVLGKVPGLQVVRGRRCTSRHAAPWEEGYMIWQDVQDVLELLRSRK